MPKMKNVNSARGFINPVKYQVGSLKDHLSNFISVAPGDFFIDDEFPGKYPDFPDRIAQPILPRKCPID